MPGAFVGSSGMNRCANERTQKWRPNKPRNPNSSACFLQARLLIRQVLSSALGWQRHTTSAALTRLKQEGYPLQSSKPDGSARVYELSGDLTPGSKAARKAEAAAKANEAATRETEEGKA